MANHDFPSKLQFLIIYFNKASTLLSVSRGQSDVEGSPPIDF